MMTKMMTAVMILMVVSMGFCQSKSTTSTTDYFNVPTAKVLPTGTMAIDSQFTGEKIWGHDNSLGTLVDIGISNNMAFSTTTDDLRDSKTSHIIGSYKYVVGQKDVYSGGGQLAVFLYNIGKNKQLTPGTALTVDIGKLSTTVSGWFLDNTIAYGAGGTLSITKCLNLQAEYSSTGNFVYGMGFTYKNLFANLRYLDKQDDFAGDVGLKVHTW